MFMLKCYHLMEKICIKNMGVWCSFKQMKPQLCLFLKKPSLVCDMNYSKNSQIMHINRSWVVFLKVGESSTYIAT